MSQSLDLTIILFTLGYLLGSIPFGLVVTKLAGIDDIRQIGSGNIGATNVLRTGSKTLAGATLVGDMLKGTAAALIGAAFSRDVGAAAAGLGAFLGHLFPVWLGFRGGKGVATYIGVILAWHWPVAIVLCGIWLLVAIVTRYSSLAALVACLVPPIYFALSDIHISYTASAALMAILLYYRHRENIARLIRGSESRIGSRSS